MLHWYLAMSTPSLLAALLCDQVIVDQLTQKKTLVGLFEAVTFASFPASYGGFFLFARMTDAEQQMNLKIRLVRLDEDKALAEIATIVTVEGISRLSIFDVMMQLPALPFDRVGRYELQLFSDEVYLGRTVIEVKSVSGG